MERYRIFWTNMGYYSQEEFTSLADAIAYGKSKCFEFTVHHAGEILASWTVFGGTRMHAVLAPAAIARWQRVRNARPASEVPMVAG